RRASPALAWASLSCVSRAAKSACWAFWISKSWSICSRIERPNSPSEPPTRLASRSELAVASALAPSSCPITPAERPVSRSITSSRRSRPALPLSSRAVRRSSRTTRSSRACASSSVASREITVASSLPRESSPRRRSTATETSAATSDRSPAATTTQSCQTAMHVLPARPPYSPTGTNCESESQRVYPDKPVTRAPSTICRVQGPRRKAVPCPAADQARARSVWISPSMERSEEHTSEFQSRENLVCRLLLEKKMKKKIVFLADILIILSVIVGTISCQNSNLRVLVIDKWVGISQVHLSINGILQSGLIAAII